MDVIVVPSEVKGTIRAPSSKSMSQRAIAAALLSDTECTILNPSYCNDSLAAISIAENLGASIEKSTTELKILSSHKIKDRTLNCGESGLAIRMFSPIAARNPGEIIMAGTGSLRNRPMKMIEDTLNQLGAVCRSNAGLLPLTITGPIKGGKCVTDGSVSSQLLTGLLMALPVANDKSVITVVNLKSRPYIDMTLQVLEKFGIKVTNDNYEVFKIDGNQRYKATTFEVESDWSGGAFLLVAGAVNGDVTVEGLRTDSRQSDKTILTALDRAGAAITINENSVRITKSSLRSFEFDATESPDLFPPLTALSAYCKGVTGIKGVSRLIHKESDRAKALLEEFRKMNVKVEIKGDYMLVTGGKIHEARVNSHNDHRIAMAVAVAALGASGKIQIEDPLCIAKSYPGFYDDLRALGAVVSG
jgi:3-phosphoshikimate 1-carboxyvinyltransferase